MSDINILFLLLSSKREKIVRSYKCIFHLIVTISGEIGWWLWVSICETHRNSNEFDVRLAVK